MRIRILVADQSEADFYDVQHPGEAPRLVGGVEDPLARLHDRQLASDRPGRVFDHAPPATGRRGGTAHHSTGGENTPRKHEAEQFARRIVGLLEQAHRAGEFERLVVMAPPTFLGMLREALPDSVRPTVAAEVSKDLVHSPAAEVQAHLPPRVFAPASPQA